MSNWIYQGREVLSIEDMPSGVIGFIYKISKLEYNDVWFDVPQPTKFYIGKKQLYTNRRAKITQKEKLESGNNRKKFKQIIKESDWLTYNSSCLELKKEIKELGEDAFLKEILLYCFDKRELNYEEVRQQFLLEVLERDTYNGNIASRWFKKKE